jgi:hypothetical protein
MIASEHRAMRDRVARGAALLDDQRPGWAGEIDLDWLSMESCTSCVIGQLYADYFIGGRILTENLPNTFFFSAAAHGFTLPEEDQNPPAIGGHAEVMRRFAALADAWRDEVRQRTEAR